MAEGYEIKNIGKRRQMVFENLIEELKKTYYQYDTEYNKKIMKAFLRPMFNASLIGYEYQNKWPEQEKEELEDAVYRLFRIKRTFKDITLTDEQFIAVASFAEAVRLADSNDLESISKAIENSITKEFAIFSNPREVLYVLFADEEVIEALIYYKLLPVSISSNTKIVAIPKELEGRKIWSWAIAPEGRTTYYMPDIFSSWLYLRDETGKLSNPLLLLPEWYKKVPDSESR